jgi:transcriptional regulator with XRE-family HTH domain
VKSHSFPYIVAYRFKQARILRGLTQEQVAKRAGMTVSMVSHYETGLMNETDRKVPYLPTLINARRICAALDVSLDWVVGLSNEMES